MQFINSLLWWLLIIALFLSIKHHKPIGHEVGYYYIKVREEFTNGIMDYKNRHEGQGEHEQAQ